jgi:predicted CXXCH cytochrome family protein
MRLATTLALHCGIFALLAATAVGQQSSIVNTKHNLSTSGPGPFKATLESRICVFCHTPHRARSTAPLWNREDSTETYMTYNSTTFGGSASQPNGASKLCLSCHDGSIALGKIVNADQDIAMGAGHEYLNQGSAFLGTTLDNDHPISFHYSSSKGGSGVEYLTEGAIVPPVSLDQNGMVQCTSCHDSHNNQFGDFLHATNRNSDLCLSCHVPHDWSLSPHSTSNATWNGNGTDPWPGSNYTTVAENACANCHQTHGAGHPQRLLGHMAEEDNCLKCHSGTVASKNIATDLGRISAHVPYTTTGVHDPVEDPLVMPRHAECQDCHNPHAARPGTAAAPGVPGPILGVSGISSSGQFVPEINFGYELCYKCHADNNGGNSFLPRVVHQTNTRLEFDTQNPSFHPVEGPGASNDVPSLKPPYTTSSVISCWDCHQSNTSPAAGGNGPSGPHGSNNRPILVANYSTQEYVNESPSAYALCYMCHNRNSILNDESFEEHDKHITGKDTPCSACHDGHGISSIQGTSTSNSHLINFNASYVTPSSKNGRLEFVDEGFRRGRCSLECHGEDHDDEDYKP